MTTQEQREKWRDKARRRYYKDVEKSREYGRIRGRTYYVANREQILKQQRTRRYNKYTAPIIEEINRILEKCKDS